MARDDDDARAATLEAATDSLSGDLASLATLLQQVAHAPGDDQVPDIDVGQLAGGGFEIEHQLGAGGMGVVYLARDTTLDRKVAIKVHKVRAGDAGFDRLMREATAMARLSHPNVVAVHEVEQAGDQLFIVMEYMDGGTLGQWLTKQRPSRDQILDAFAAAGEGLAAAHEAGLVHRDFKPENVFRGASGRVCVADFGLARSAETLTDVSSGSGERAISSGNLDSKLTATGATVGTPLYMAPEQFAGGSVDARADQFAFCVALYEALYRKHPFGGRGMRELRAAVLNGNLRPPPREVVLPGWLRAIVVRGLARDPGDRFPDMRALLDALARGRGRRRRLAMVAVPALVAVVAAGATWGLAGGESGPEPCTGAADHMVGVWDVGARAEVEAGFGASNAPFAGRAFERVAQVLDRYRGDWIAMRTQACRATVVEGDQSQSLMDLRMACLDRRRGELAALVSLLADEPGVEVIATAVEAAYKLTPLDGCANADALLAAYPPPDDAATADAVRALRERLDQVEALRKTGQYKRAVEQAISIEEASRNVDYPPLRAEALLLVGQLETLLGQPAEAEPALRSAAEAAARARDDRRVAMAWTDLVRVLGYLGAKHDEALRVAETAKVALLRAGGDVPTEATLLRNEGVILRRKGDGAGAENRYEQAIALLDRELGGEHPLLIAPLYNLANLRYAAKDYAAAEKLYRRSGDIAAKTLGEAHPDVIDAELAIANIQRARGDASGAVQSYRRGLSLQLETLGAEHPRVALSHSNLGRMLVELGRYDEARRELETAHRVWRTALGADHPNVTRPMVVLARLDHLEARDREAHDRINQVIAVLEAAYGTDHEELAEPLVVRALVQVALGASRAAMADCRRALAIAESKKLPDQLIGMASDCVREASK